jgi:transposase
MNRERFVLSDIVWQKIEALLPGKKSDRGVTARNNRLFLEAVLWRVRAGLPWRDLPAEFGHWNSVFTRFRRWARAKVFDRIFKDAALDRGDVSAKLRADLAAQECTVHTPPKQGMLNPPPWDKAIYAQRHAVENTFSRLKDGARIALRRDKTRRGWMGFAYLAAAIINLRLSRFSHTA